MKKYIFLLLIILLSGCQSPNVGGEIADSLKLKAAKEDILKADTTGEEVIYKYNTKIKVEDEKDEIVALREPSAKFYEKDGKKMARFYTDEVFMKSGDDWVYTEFGTTTKDAWDEHTKVSFWEKLLGQEALAVDTFYASTSDGFVRVVDADWATCQGQANGELVDTTSDSVEVRTDDGYPTGGNQIISRAFFSFNTSSLPDDATISSSTFHLYTYGVPTSTDNDGDDWINIVRGTLASPPTIASGDYDTCGDAIDNPTEGSDRIDISNMSQFNWHNWILNSTGRGWVSKTSWTILGMREGHDALDHQIAINQIALTSFFSAESFGTTSDPYLEVEYTTGGTATTPRRQSEFFIE